MSLNALFESSERFLEVRQRTFSRYFDISLFDQKPITLLVGQRGVGKTTLLIQYLNLKRQQIRAESTLYVQADHLSVGELSLYEIAESFCAEGGRVLCIDEIHKHAHWSKQLKSIIDSYPQLEMVVSGSSLLELTKGSHDLSRRVVVRSLFGFSFREYLNYKEGLSLSPLSLKQLFEDHVKVTKEIHASLNQINILESFHEYLKRGYYPYSFDLKNEESYFITLEQGLHATVESDLLAVHPELTGLSIQRLFKLFQVISSNVPYEPDLKELKKMVQIGDDRTLKIYLNYLHQAGVLRNLFASNKSIKALEKPVKIYLNNSNLLWAVGNSSSQIDRGTLRETYLLSALPFYRVSYSKQGDFLVDGKHTIEVGGKNKTQKQLRGLSNSYIAMDGIEQGYKNVIPLWLFGFLY